MDNSLKATGLRFNKFRTAQFAQRLPVAPHDVDGAEMEIFKYDQFACELRS